MKFPWPLRYTIPGMILLLGTLLGVSSLLYERKKSNDQIEYIVKRDAQFIGNQISTVSSYFVSHKDLAGVQHQLSALGADPILRLAVVCDDHLKVVASSQFQFRGASLDATPLRYARDLISRTKRSSTFFINNRQTVL